MSNVDALRCGQDVMFMSNSYIASRIIKQFPNIAEQIHVHEGVKNYQIGDVFSIKCSVNDAKNIIFVITRPVCRYAKESEKSMKMYFSNVFKSKKSECQLQTDYNNANLKVL